MAGTSPRSSISLEKVRNDDRACDRADRTIVYYRAISSHGLDSAISADALRAGVSYAGDRAGWLCADTIGRYEDLAGLKTCVLFSPPWACINCPVARLLAVFYSVSCVLIIQTNCSLYTISTCFFLLSEIMGICQIVTLKSQMDE